MIDSNVPFWLSWLRRLCYGYCETGDIVCVELVILILAEFTVQLYPDYYCSLQNCSVSLSVSN